MNEKQMTLATDWQGENVAGWYWSEKLDGVRAYWDGACLWTRGGNAIHAPAWLTAGLPKRAHLDCEVWAGRGHFNEARLAVQNGRWLPDIRLAVFDAPRAPGDWRERMEESSGLVADAPAAFAVGSGTITSLGQLRRELNRVLRDGGEGLVLRKPGVGYEIGRTRNTLKVKDILYI